VTFHNGKTLVLYEARRTADSVIGVKYWDEVRLAASSRPQTAFATADLRQVQQHRLDGGATAAVIVVPIGILAIVGYAAMASWEGPWGGCC